MHAAEGILGLAESHILAKFSALRDTEGITPLPFARLKVPHDLQQAPVEVGLSKRPGTSSHELPRKGLATKFQ